MYQNFFGFREKPFRLVPNPAYLFLSRIHEEALAHLNYAVSQGEGFVQITGEVGTGKTTLCRSFLENLDENTEAAYIFNPKLDALQLLKAIIDEFGISVETESLKDLIDALNSFLIEEKSRGKNVVLLIDEAQNLSLGVLEQIRLLSNLETTTSKLLQIILVGQPELEQMLNTPQIRQLGQRITLRCSLTPLTFTETRDYIRHRINIASRRPGIVFPGSAVRVIYRYAEGIPRLINIACDRTLLTAFGLNRHRISGKHARSAIRELSGSIRKPAAGLFEGNRGLLVFSALCFILLTVVWRPPAVLKQLSVAPPKDPAYITTHTKAIKIPHHPASRVKQAATQKTTPLFSEQKTGPGPEVSVASEDTATDAFDIDSTPAATEKKALKSFKPAMLTQPVKAEKSERLEPGREKMESLFVEDFGNWLLKVRPHIRRAAAMTAALGLWNKNISIGSQLAQVEDDQVFFRMAAQSNGFLYQSIPGNLGLMRALNLPAIIGVLIPDGSSRGYMTVKRLGTDTVTLVAGRLDPVRVNLEQLKTFWTGEAMVPWKNFLSCTGVIPKSAPRDSVMTLKIMLKEMGYSDIAVNADYDAATESAIKKIQTNHGILPDGVVGPLTKIILYNAYGSFKIPHIRTD